MSTYGYILVLYAYKICSIILMKNFYSLFLDLITPFPTLYPYYPPCNSNNMVICVLVHV